MKETCSNFCLAEWMAPDATPTGKMIYAYIFSFWLSETVKRAKCPQRKSEGREAFFSLRTFAKRFDSSFYGIQNSLYVLERLGYITVTLRPGNRSTYTIVREKALESLKGYSDSATVYRSLKAGTLRRLLEDPSEKETQKQIRKIREIAKELNL